jgi:excisionase family DNA binding protein
VKTSLNYPPEAGSPQDRPLLCRISTAMKQLAVSRTTIYRLVARGDLDLVKIGGRSSRITSESMMRLLVRQRDPRVDRRSPST